MATVTYSSQLGFHGKVSDFIDFTALSPTSSSPTQFTLQDNSGGDGFTVQGTDLTYTGLSVTGGTVTGVLFFAAGFNLLMSVEGLSVPATTFASTYAASGGAGVVALMMSGADSITGSAIGDMIAGGAGNDTINGGAGADIILGQKGNDVLTGGLGADTFKFAPHEGHDRITDFHDANLASDDKISMTHAMYNAMTVTETTAGVTLHFDALDSVFVAHWTIAQMDLGDFTLV